MSKNSVFIEQMTNMLIRPSRDVYPSDQLGSKQLIVKRKFSSTPQQANQHLYSQVHRKDQTLSCKGTPIQLSYYYPATKHQNPSSSPVECVIYLHANSGSRIQGTFLWDKGIEVMKHVLALGCNLAIFDCRGSGISGGEHTSMGVNQSQDLQIVLEYLKGKEGISNFALWGRSMGAVTILYFLLKRYNQLHKTGVKVHSIVLDSPFSNLKKLMHQIGSTYLSLPQFIFNPLAQSINQQVIAKLGVNLLQQLNLHQQFQQLKTQQGELYQTLFPIQALFLTSNQDKLVNASHVVQLHQSTPFKQKQLHYYSGEHNAPRSDSTVWKCTYFACLQSPPPQKSKQTTPNKSNSLYSISMKSYYKNNQAAKKTDVINKLNKSSNEQKGSQLHFTGPNKKKEYYSPKFQKDIEKLSKQHEKEGKIDVKQYSSEHARPIPTQPQQHIPQTIIINHNYNVSVNVIGSPPHQQPIPPINFNNTTSLNGYMTDRFNDSHMPQRYFVPHTVKTQKNQNGTGSLTSISQKRDLNAGSLRLQNRGYIQHKREEKKEPQIQIPLIKFEGIEQHQPLQTEIQVVETEPQWFKYQGAQNNSLMSSQNSYSSHGERQKMSLSELRKLQKEEHNKCTAQTSKLISFKQKKEQDTFEKLNLKKAVSNPFDESHQYRSHEPPNSKPPRMMKTSLMTRNKKNQRKNSDSANNTVKSLVMKTQPREKNHVSIFEMGRPHVNSPKNENGRLFPQHF